MQFGERCLFALAINGLLAVGVLVGTAAAQTTSSTSEADRRAALLAMGTGKEPMAAEDYAKLPVSPLTRAYIPDAVDLSSRFPPPGDQGNIGSCVSWATSYAARSYMAQPVASTPANMKSDLPSPAYIHNWLHWRRQATTGRPEACHNAGQTFVASVNFIGQFGALPLSQYDEKRFCPPAQEPGPQQLSKFPLASIDKLSWLRPEWKNRKLEPGAFVVDLDRIRLRLSEGHPVLYGMFVNEAFRLLGPKDVFRERVTKSEGGHAMVIVGYDDRRQAFRLLNSWGTQWADGGFGWISADSLAYNGEEVVVMRTASPPARPPAARPQSRVSEFTAQTQLRCAEVDAVRSTTDQLKFTGYVSTATDLAVVQKVAADNKFTSEVVLRPWPVCEAMLTLREPMRAPSKPKIGLVGGERTLKVGDSFALQVTAPDVPAFLYVIYIEDDGTVVNLNPRRGPVRRQMQPTDQPLLFGDGKEGRPTFRVTALKSTDEAGAPRPNGDPLRGHEAVVAIASRAPIQELEDEENPDSRIYRVAAKTASADGSPDRLFLSKLRDIVLRSVAGKDLPEGVASALPREVMADVLHLRIAD